MKTAKAKKPFSLIEPMIVIMIVITIVLILTALLLPTCQKLGFFSSHPDVLPQGSPFTVVTDHHGAWAVAYMGHPILVDSPYSSYAAAVEKAWEEIDYDKEHPLDDATEAARAAKFTAP